MGGGGEWLGGRSLHHNMFNNILRYIILILLTGKIYWYTLRHAKINTLRIIYYQEWKINFVFSFHCMVYEKLSNNFVQL